MIISYSNDFVFVRIPKCASTTCAVGLYDMGLVVESEGDICSGIEGSDHGQNKTEGRGSGRLPINYPYGGSKTQNPLLDHNLVNFGQFVNDTKVHRQHIWHTPYHKMVEVGLVEEGMPCVSTIRHPVSRFMSIVSYLTTFGKKSDYVLSEDPNSAWDRFKEGEVTFSMWDALFKAPQNYFVPEGATLFNVENTYDWLERFSKEKGVEYIKPEHFKNNKENQKILLTEARQQEIMEWFEDDLLLWEKSYREFN